VAPVTKIEAQCTVSDISMNDQDEYAEEYSKRERIRFVIIAAVILLPLVLLMELWVFPALREFAEKSQCYQVFGVSGTALLMYGLFTGLPLFAAAVLGLPLAWRGLRIVRDRRSPPLGAKVFLRTRLRRGRKAVLIGWTYQIPFLYLLTMAAWGVSKSEDILLSHASSRADYSVCAPVESGESPAGGKGALRPPADPSQ
jgi:hypothetical protein